MPNLMLNRAKATTATTGAGTVTLSSGVTPYQSWSSAGAVNGGVYDYLIEDGTAWEIGYGTYTSSGTTLSRTLVASSSGSLLSLSGSATVSMISSARQLNNMAVQTHMDPLYTFPTKPVAANFTLSTTTGGPSGLAINDLQNRGVNMFCPANTSGLINFAALQSTPVGTGDFTFTSLCRFMPTNYGNFAAGVCLKDSAGKLLQWGVRNTTFSTFRYDNINSLSWGTTKNGGSDLIPHPVWWRIAKAGGNFTFSVSLNGETYHTVFTESATAFLASSISSFGLIISNNGVNQTLSIDCYSMDLV